MKNFLFILMVVLFINSCKSNSEEEKNTGNSEIIEIGQDKIDQNSNKDEEDVLSQKEIKLNPKFKQFLDKFKKVSLPYKIEPEEKLNVEVIPFTEQAKYLTSAEDLNEKELKEMEPYAKFYYLSNPVSTNRFKGIVYARSEMGSSYYILCTFDNHGNYLSSIDFAMYQLIGAGPQAGQEYSMTGSIDENLEITIVSDDKTKHYKIDEEGKIIEK